jgi:hypothetical protein
MTFAPVDLIEREGSKGQEFAGAGPIGMGFAHTGPITHGRGTIIQ